MKDEKLKLKGLFEAGESFSKIVAELSKTEVAVGLKLKRLKLKDDQTRKKFGSSSSTEVVLPAMMLLE